MAQTSAESCIFYNPRRFPTATEMAAWYLYFDRIFVIPPAQSALVTHFAGDVFDIDDVLDVTASFADDAGQFENLIHQFPEPNSIVSYDLQRTRLLDEMTFEVWSQLGGAEAAGSRRVEDFLDLRDSLVTSVFAHSTHEVVLQGKAPGIGLLAKPAISAVLPLIQERLPAVATEDFEILQSLKSRTRSSVNSLKSFLRAERHKFIGVDAGATTTWSHEHQVKEFRSHLRDHIAEVKNGLETILTKLGSERAEVGFNAALTFLAGVGLVLVGEPFTGILGTIAAEHAFAQKWRTLKDHGETARFDVKEGEAGLFLIFEELSADEQ